MLCGNKTQVSDPASALSLVATWIFPLAILLNLPYESHHREKIRKTLESISNWLGSPQSALTATLWNFRQIRECHRRSREDNLDRDLSNAYYVASCMNQFAVGCGHAVSDEFYQVLAYGLFRPGSQLDDHLLAANEWRVPVDMDLTGQLLANMAFQLRMLRRRGVIPTLSSLATFLVAFVFSVVLAFGNLGDHTDFLALSLGLLVMWLPLLVIFTIVDRNPISSERSAELMSRWLWNVRAVKRWAAEHKMNPGCDSVDDIQWWTPGNRNDEDFPIGEFVGQGRRMMYCGLAHALMRSVSGDRRQFGNEMAHFDRCGSEIQRRLRGHKPFSWYVTAIASLFLVSAPVMMAVMFAFSTPVVGPGCWSGSCFMFGVLSSVSWLIQFSKHPPKWAVVIAHVFNAIAVLWLVATIVLQITGAFNNCWCLAAPIASPVWGGYVEFGDAQLYKEVYDVLVYWATAAVVGGLVPIVAFVVAVFWWLKCQHLWATRERGIREEVRLKRVHADMSWLQ